MTGYQEGMTGFDRFVAELQQQINEQEFDRGPGWPA
jgi:hypothetical protein